MAPPDGTSGDDFEVELLRRAEARVGRVLKDKWKLHRVLGVGGFAVVYEATHRAGKRVAVKMMHPELALEPELRARFVREAYVANHIDHPGIVSIADDDVAEDGALFLVMDLLEGEDVEQRRVRLGGRLPVTEVLSVADHVLDVLATAHGKGVVHRDLKPHNLFLTRTGQVKVLDFGIARAMALSGGKTRSGLMLGSPGFMPPEQARGDADEIDARSDLWALGATLFTLLTGRLVHDAPTPIRLVARAMEQPAAPLSSAWPEAPPAVASLIDRALAFEKSARWPGAREMQEAVRCAYSAITESPVSTEPLPPVAGTPSRDISLGPTQVSGDVADFAASSTLPAKPTERSPSAPEERTAKLVSAAGARTGAPVSSGRTGVDLHPRAGRRRLGVAALIVAAAAGAIALATLHEPAGPAIPAAPGGEAPEPAAATPPPASAPAASAASQAPSAVAPASAAPVASTPAALSATRLVVPVRAPARKAEPTAPSAAPPAARPAGDDREMIRK